MSKYIEIGKITNTHGLKGELKMIYWCNDPDFLSHINYFFLDDSGKEKLKVKYSRFHKNFLIIKVDGIDNISQTRNFMNKILYILKDEILLKEGEYLQCDLIGLNVIDIDNGKVYGRIYKIIQTGANDVYYIKDKNNKERLIPAIKDVIKRVNLESKEMLIKPLNGLFEI